MITRRTLLGAALAPLLGAGLALPLAAQQTPIPLSELSRYFNAIQTAEARFTQINGDGSISTGRLFIHRPGRMRFEYDPPDPNLVLAGGGQVAIFDHRSNQGPTQYPLRRTPLNLILAQNVDLGADRMVVRHYAEDNTTTVVAQDPEHPEYGNIRLVFTADPTELRQWVVTDDMGRETTLILQDLTLGPNLSANLFNISAETDRRRRD